MTASIDHFTNTITKGPYLLDRPGFLSHPKMVEGKKEASTSTIVYVPSLTNGFEPDLTGEGGKNKSV